LPGIKEVVMSPNAAMRLMLPEPQDDGAQLALEAAGVGIWEIRPRTGEHRLSSRSRELLGIGEDELISVHRLIAALHPADRERWKDAVAEVLDPEGGGECSIEFRTAETVPRWLAISGRAFFEGMRAVRVTGTLRDISEQKRIEGERDFHLGELGHDLRVPLQAISMGIEMLQREAPAEPKVVSAMQRTVKAMARLIDQLLAGAREGTVRPNRERGPLAAVCRQAVDEASLAYPGRPIELECWDEVPGWWDSDRLLEAVRNLLANAIEHGADGESIVVSVIDCNKDALISVANFGGRPIPDEFRSHLFACTGARSSDHLGLYIVGEIVRQHGGRVELTSDESATAFHLWLPKHGGLS
jgi:PAS domain S-box-containing protein